MLDLQHVKTFVEVVAAKSFTGAAIKLGYSQSTVTLHVKALEKEIGVNLLDRFRFARRISLTEAGQRVHASAILLLALADDVKSAFRKNRNDAA